MNNLSQECIEQIEKAATRKKSIWHYQPFINGATEALTNPTIYQSAGLMTVEEALRFTDWIKNNCEIIERDLFINNQIITTKAELLTIFRNQNQEK